MVDERLWLDVFSCFWTLLNSHWLLILFFDASCSVVGLTRGSSTQRVVRVLWYREGGISQHFLLPRAQHLYGEDLFLFSVLLWGGSHLPQPLYTIPFFAVVGSPALSTSCPHISCPLSHGNHLLCFFLIAAYTFGLFDHSLSSWASNTFVVMVGKYFRRLQCPLVLEAQKASTGQLPEAGELVYKLSMTLQSSCLGGLQLWMSE